MSKIISFIKHEPVVILAGFVNAGLELLVQFGLHLTDKQQAAILALSLAIVALVTRSQVSPVAKVEDAEG